MSTTAWIILGLAAVALAWAVGAYNRLVQLRNRIPNALAQIDVQLKRRYDLIPNLVETARGYLAHEAVTLEAVIKARGQAQGAASAVRSSSGSAQALGSLAVAEGVLGGALDRLMVLTEAYPDLKADATMQSLSEELTSTENRLGFARQAYNDHVLEYNDQATQFPELIVARLLGFSAAPMLESTHSEEERAVPKVQF